MIKFITRLIYKLPKRYSKVWYNASAHMSGEVYPLIYDDNSNYIDCREGLLVVMKIFPGNKRAYYKVVKIHQERNGDWRYDSDRIKADMKFSHVK